MPQTATARRTLNRSELAAHHGVSLPQVDTWVRRGCPAIERGSKGTNWKFDPAAVIDWRLKDAADEVTARFITGDGNMSREEADRRRAVALARSAEIELAERLKAVASVEDMATDTLSFCHVLKNGLDGAAHKIASRAASMTSAVEIHDMCRAEFNRAFSAAKVELERVWKRRDDGRATAAP